MKPDIYDLRSAIDFLKSMPGEYAETDVEIDPCCEITGVYRYLGAGAAVKRPTKKGPALMFNNIKGHPNARCFIGGLGSRERTAKILGTTPEQISYFLKDCAENPIWPVEVPRSEAKTDCDTLCYRTRFSYFKICSRRTGYTRRLRSIYYSGIVLCK